MRTIKELLQLVLKHGNRDFCKSSGVGICAFCNHLTNSDIISSNENNRLVEYIRENRPKPDSPHFVKERHFSFFYWPIFKWAPRKRWLEDQIKSL